MIKIVYDGSFEGLFTAIFEVLEYRFADVEIVPEANFQPDFFSEKHHVLTDSNKSERVLSKLEHQIGKDGIRTLLQTFFSEDRDLSQIIFEVVKYAVSRPEENVLKDFAYPAVLRAMQLAKSVSREAHRMKAFTRFEKMSDGTFAAKISPDFNVLGLMVHYFKNRYQDQKWLVYDIRRDYGFYYDLKETTEIILENSAFLDKLNTTETLLHEEEAEYQKLWQRYFTKTNIKERRNDRLHLQHVPRRYWKYLTEKKL